MASPDELAAALGKAVLQDDVVALSQLIDAGAEVDREVHVWTPLRMACSHGHAEMVSRLLDAGAEADRADTNGNTPLHLACGNGHLDIASRLLDAGAKVDRADTDGITPLHFACGNGHLDVASRLLDAGAEVDRANTSGHTPLIIACGKGHPEVASWLIDAGAEVDREDKDGITCATLAAPLIRALLGPVASYTQSSRRRRAQRLRATHRRAPGAPRRRRMQVRSPGIAHRSWARTAARRPRRARPSDASRRRGCRRCPREPDNGCA